MRRSSLFAAGLVALVVALTAAPAAVAQVVGLYYQEVEKDGRVYVFNTVEKYKLFQDSGDMGIAITLPGAGVDGVTVVAENETAADLYFFKHNLPGYERPAPNTTPAFTVSWKDGKTTIESKLARLDISNRLQIRYTQEMPETGDDVGSFRLRRMRTKFEGWVYTKDLTYELQFDTAAQTNLLQDADINYDFTKGRKTFQLKAGQFKVPFGRQELTSSGSQQFVDRSIVSAEFARGRDIGVQLWGTPLQGRLDWRVGVFNGNGRTVERNDNDQLQTNARLTFQPFGDVKYSESDFEGTDRPLLAIAAQYENNERPLAASGSIPADTAEREILGADVVFKFKGLSIFAEYFDATTDRGRQSDFDSDGLHAQVGYFIIPQKLELAGRYAVIDPNADRDNDEREERGIVAGYFFNKHNHKLQADYRQLETRTGPGSDVTNDEFRLQYQLIF